MRSASEALALVSAGIGIHHIPSSAATPFPGVVYRRIVDSRSRLVLLHRPLPPAPVRLIVELAKEMFGDAPGASNDAGEGLAETAAVG